MRQGKTRLPDQAPRLVGAALLVGVAYYLTARLGIALTFQPTPVSTLWAPNAVLLAAMVLTPVSIWPVLLGGALPAHLAVEYSAGVPLPMVLCWFVSNSGEALLGAIALRKFTPFPPRLDRVRCVGAFIIFAALLAPIASSFADAGFVWLNGWGHSGFWTVWRTRTFSNVLAETVVVPLILGWSATGGLGALRSAPFRRYVEAATLSIALMAVSLLVFNGLAPGPRATPALLYAPLPLLLWATVRFGLTGASTSLFAALLIAMLSAVHGRGPFLTATPRQNALSIQLFFFMMAVTLITLSAVLAEWRRARDAARLRGDELHLAMEAARMVAWELPLPGDWTSGLLWSTGEDRVVQRDRAVAAFLAPVHPEDRRRVWSAIARAVEMNEPYAIEHRVLRADGTVGWVMSKGDVRRDAAGWVNGIIGVSADITQRKRAEEVIGGQNRILEMMATGASLADVLTAIAHLIERESPGLLCSILLADDDRAQLRLGAAPSLPGSYTRAIEGARIDLGSAAAEERAAGTGRGRHSAGLAAGVPSRQVREADRDLGAVHGLRLRWSTPILSPEGRLLGFVEIYSREPHAGLVEDPFLEAATQLAAIAIERRRVEWEAHAQQRQLAQLGRVAVLGEISGSIAHELRQPLTSILSNAQAGQRFLGRDPPDLDQLASILADIVAADLRANEVIRGVRSMLEKGQAELVPLSVNEVVEQALRLARYELRAREISVVTRLEPNLPDVLGDPVQLQQVLLNLVINACEAMAEVREGQRALTIATECAAGAISLTVADRGRGIQEEAQSRIFEPLFTSKPHGLGLGLSICRSIVRAHHGQVWAVNNPGQGATIYVTLPPARGRLERQAAYDRVGEGVERAD